MTMRERIINGKLFTDECEDFRQNAQPQKENKIF